MTRAEFDEYLREQIRNGEMTPEEAESEFDFFVNGADSFESIYGR